MLRYRDYVKRVTWKFIEEYIPYIRYCISKRRYLQEHKEDAEQFVVVCLLKMYPNCYKYTNWDWVVRTAVRRKLIDFSAKFNRDNRLICENVLTGKKDTDLVQYADLFGVPKDEVPTIQELADIVRGLYHRIKEQECASEDRVYTTFEYNYITTVLLMLELGTDIEPDTIMQCMEWPVEDKENFVIQVARFHEKIRNSIPKVA